MKALAGIKRIVKVVLLVSAILFGISLFQKNKLPGKEDILAQLYQEPTQTETDVTPFEVERKGVTYEIVPLYNYELYGLVVSYHHSKSWWDYYHEKWKDFINIKDICVIWGNNIKTGVYEEMTFRSGSWCCYFDLKQSADPEWWSKFENSSGSNNHLLAGDERVSEAIMDAEKGDQIYLKGYLVEYSHGEEFQRGTSTSRTDTGNRACETIYVTDFQILKKANPLWHSIYTVTGYLILGSLAFLTLFFFGTPIRRPPRLLTQRF